MRGRRSVVPLAVLAVIGACGETDGPSADGTVGHLTVFAAASLAEAFTDAADAFHAGHPDADVTVSFDASSALAQQIIRGAPADVVATADTTTMDQLTEGDLVTGPPSIFATNRLAIIVAPGNPLAISGVADLARDDVTTVICAPEVPCGQYAEEVLAAAGVTIAPASLERNVRGVTTKVTAGEADAGLAYETDVLAAGATATLVEIPAALNVAAEYPIAAVADSEEPELARAFVDFVLSEDGQAILAEHGFGPP